MVTVYFEIGPGKDSELVAKFDNSETYEACFPALVKLCEQRGFIYITESITEEEL